MSAAPLRQQAPVQSRPTTTVGRAAAPARSAAPSRSAASARSAPARSAQARSAPSRAAAPTRNPMLGTRAHLHAVSAPARSRSLMPFAVLCVAIVVGALTSVLLLNTAMARGSYESVQIRRDIAQLHQDRAALLTQLEAASAPGGLAAAAQELGMVPAGRMGFVSLAQGAVLESSAG